jgi:hypothetical protein
MVFDGRNSNLTTPCGLDDRSAASLGQPGRGPDGPRLTSDAARRVGAWQASASSAAVPRHVVSFRAISTALPRLCSLRCSVASPALWRDTQELQHHISCQWTCESWSTGEHPDACPDRRTNNPLLGLSRKKSTWLSVLCIDADLQSKWPVTEQQQHQHLLRVHATTRRVDEIFVVSQETPETPARVGKAHAVHAEGPSSLAALLDVGTIMHSQAYPSFVPACVSLLCGVVNARERKRNGSAA